MASGTPITPRILIRGEATSGGGGGASRLCDDERPHHIPFPWHFLRFRKEWTTFMRGEILGYVKCDISADLERDNHSWWGLKRESPRVSALSELMWACYCLDYKRGELTAIIEKDHFGLICSDNNKGSSNNLSSEAQSSSIRHRLGTQSGWIHFTCFFFWFSFSAAVPDGEKLLETDSLNFYEARIPLRHHLRIEATARTQLRRCQRKLLIKQISFLLYTVRQERRKKSRH